jgi:Flp pilus assembly protein TadD
MTRLALGSSLTIGTLICLPDAFALLPAVPDTLTWAVRLSGLWLTAIILWFLGFLGLLSLTRAAMGPVIISEAGVKLWRLGKPVAWSSIRALGTEEQKLFARVFWLARPVLRLTLYTGGQSGKLKTQFLPSFIFSKRQFGALVRYIAGQVTGARPQGVHVLLFSSQADLDLLKQLCQRSHRARLLLSVVIAFGLTAFLGRKAVVNYNFNDGSRAFRQADYRTARDRYALASQLDPTFAAAWDQLARSEFRLGASAAAERHWRKALGLKPDLAEAKLGLSFLYMQRRQFDKARPLVEQTIRLYPTHVPARVNLACLYLYTGRTTNAVALAERLLSEEPDNLRVRCVLAQGYLRLGRIEQAERTMAAQDRQAVEPTSRPFYHLVKAEIALARGNLQTADRLLAPLSGQFTGTAEALVDMAELRTAQSRYAEAERLVARARAAGPLDPWPGIAAARLAGKQGNRAKCLQELSAVVALNDEDARALAACARLYYYLGQKDKASELAGRALAVEPSTPDALFVMRTTQPERQ